MPSPNPLTAALYQFVRAVYEATPGSPRITDVIVRFEPVGREERGRTQTYTVYEDARVARPQSEVETVQESAAGDFDDCDRAIFQAIILAGKNLIGAEIVAAVNPEPGRENWSERTISGHLAELVKCGRLVNHGKRQGYGLPGW